MATDSKWKEQCAHQSLSTIDETFFEWTLRCNNCSAVITERFA